MSYIGSTPTTQSFIAGTDYFNGTGSQVAFTLSRSVNSVNDIEVIVNNVEQIPSGYLVSGTTLTFSAAPSAGTSNVYVRYLSTTNLSLAIPAGTSASFNTVGVSGNLAFTGTGNRITGDFSNATLANRLMFQTATAGAGTSVTAIPNATGDNSAYNIFSSPDVANSSFGQFRVGAGTGDVRITSGITGTGTYLPMTLYTGGSERVRIDTSGNVGIGTSSPNGKLDVKTATDSKITFNDGSTTGNVRMEAVNATYSAYKPLELNGSVQIFATGASERMRIDSSGNVGIGMTPTNFGNGYTVLQVANASNGGMLYLTNTANAGGRIYGNGAGLTYDAFSTTYHAFNTNGTERARIDAGGNLLVGTTSAPAKFSVVSSGDTSYFQTTGTTSTCSYWKVGSNSSCFYQLFQNVAGSNIGWIRTTDGSTVQYYTGSDQRLKKNIAPANLALDRVLSLKVRSYDWKATGSHVDYGFIAQELAEVASDAVSVGKDHKDGTVDVPWGVEYAKLVPMLTAAIQEQQTLITALTARITALEAK